jgi:hypothetical protein
VIKNIIDELTSSSISRWTSASDLHHGFKDHLTVDQKVEKEREYESLLQRAPVSRRGYESLSLGQRARVRARVRALIGKTLSHSRNGVGDRFFEDCERVAESFIQRAREFDAFLPESDIHQALRNVWVFNSIQQYLGLQVGFTHPSFAYSLLYPYTDNWLDSDEPSRKEKQDFVRWLGLRVEGEESETEETQKVLISNLIGMIEEDYPRRRFPEVYQSLLAILDAQRQSLRLQNTPPEVDEAKLLPLSVAKGGTSVLADGFLVQGKLEPSHVEALFEYGVLLQLIDDLQDVDEDIHSGHWTPFAHALKRGFLDAITNRLFNYTRAVLAEMGKHAAEQGKDLCQIIERSCIGLIIEAVARHQSHYTVTFLEKMESVSPVRLSYLGSLRMRLERRYIES